MTKNKLMEEFKKIGFRMNDKAGEYYYNIYNCKNNLVKSFSTIQKGIFELKDVKENLSYFANK